MVGRFGKVFFTIVRLVTKPMNKKLTKHLKQNKNSIGYASVVKVGQFAHRAETQLNRTLMR